MKLFVSGLSIIFLSVFYVPIILGLVLWIWVRWKSKISLQLLATVLVLAVGYAIPLGDVTLNSIAIARACERSGVHVHRKMAVAGYLYDISGPEGMKRYPYHFIEINKPGQSQIIRFERQPDGSIAQLLVDKAKAEVEVIDEPFRNSNRVIEGRTIVRYKPTSEILGERLTFGAIQGWLDALLIGRWFGHTTAGGCGDPIPSVDSWLNEIIPPEKIH
jgi:hypothetical protein